MNVSAFRKDMFNVLKNIVSDKPMRITNRNDTYVIMTDEDYSAMQETIYLLQDPEIKKAIFTPFDEEEWIDESEFPWNSRPDGD